MLRSMYSAVSGVKAHQTYLDVTGNNIANVNTVGFKRDVIHFRDMIYQTIKNPSQPNPGIPIGGVNPAQVGLGVAVGSIETIHTQGSLQSTGIPTDMAIQGAGFFVVRNGNQQLYTRAGNFALDKDGNLVMQGNGYLVQGYAYRDMIDPATGSLVRQKDPSLTNINIPVGQKIPAKATTLAAFRCNLCSTANSSIADLTSIPGGEAQLPRPHDYLSYGGKMVTYVGLREDVTGVLGETLFDGNMIYTWDFTGRNGWRPPTSVQNFGTDDPVAPPSSIGDRYYQYSGNATDTEVTVWRYQGPGWGSGVPAGTMGNGTSFPSYATVGQKFFLRDLDPTEPGQIYEKTVAAGYDNDNAKDVTRLLHDLKTAVPGDYYVDRSTEKIYSYSGGTSWGEDVSARIFDSTDEIEDYLGELPDPPPSTILLDKFLVGDLLYEIHNLAAIPDDPENAYRLVTANKVIGYADVEPDDFYEGGFTYFDEDSSEIWTRDGSTWEEIEYVTTAPTPPIEESFTLYNNDKVVTWLLEEWEPEGAPLRYITNLNELGFDGEQVYGPGNSFYTYSDGAWVEDSTITVIGGPGNPPEPDPEDPPESGSRWFNVGTGEFFTFGPLQGWTNEIEKDEDTYYVGRNQDAVSGEFLYSYSDGSETGPAVNGRFILDNARNLAGAQPPPPEKPGETYLDTATGIIYTANSTMTGWIPTTGSMATDTAYAIRSTGDIYVLDAGTPAVDDPPNPPVPAIPPSPVLVDGGRVLDRSTGNKNVFFYNTEFNRWMSINDTQNSPTALSPSEHSITTQRTIEAFGKSMIQAHDYEDKFTVYDSKGNPYTMVVTFRKVMDRPAEPSIPVAAESEWDWYAYYTDSSGKVMAHFGQGAGTMVFGDDGLLKRTYTYEPVPPKPDPNGTSVPSTPARYAEWHVVEKFCDPSDDGYESTAHLPTGYVVADFNLAGAQGSVVGSDYESNMIRLDFLGNEYAQTLNLTAERIDGVTSFGGQSTTKMKGQDVYAMGELQTWSVGGDGVIVGSYSNGRVLPIAQLALAMFANAQGLDQVGETCFAETINSGIAQIGEPLTGGAGSIVGNTIEMSNVDLSEEFVNLIRAQRGFQANTRVITTSDQVLEELIHLKR